MALRHPLEERGPPVIEVCPDVFGCDRADERLAILVALAVLDE
jgi:hypothetical protein